MRWLFGIVLAVFAATAVAGNLIGAIRAMRARRSFSAVPFVGAVLGSLAILVLPLENLTRFLPIILLLDFTVPLALVATVRGAFRPNSGPRT
jgi:hypothetical protein